MNYAALLALLAGLAFVSPFFVNLATQAGIPRGFSIVTTLAAAIFVIAWAVVRERVERFSKLEERIAALQARRRRTPEDLQSFFSEGEHLGDLLVEVRRPRAALRTFEAYHRLLKRGEAGAEELGVTEQVIAALRRELDERYEQEELDARI